MWLVLIKPVDLTDPIQSDLVEICLVYRKKWEEEGKWVSLPSHKTLPLISLGLNTLDYLI